MNPRTVTFDGAEWGLKVPATPVLIDLLLALPNNKPRVAAAALNLCLVNDKGEHPFSVSFLACSCNPLLYGGLIMEKLHEKLIPIGEWYALGLECMGEVGDTYNPPPSAAEVDAAADFTDPPVAPGDA